MLKSFIWICGRKYSFKVNVAVNMISESISDDLLSQIIVLIMVIPILMHFLHLLTVESLCFSSYLNIVSYVHTTCHPT